jgi:hypothetical protein
VPRRASTADGEGPDEAAEVTPLPLPASPEVDLEALDRDIAVRLGRRPD